MLSRLRDALRGLYLVSQGTTQNFEARITGTKDHAGPAGDSKPEYDRYVERYRREGLSLELVEEAEETLANWKRQPEPTGREYERDTLAWKRRIATDERPASEVARVNWVSRQTVYNYRKLYATTDND